MNSGLDLAILQHPRRIQYDVISQFMGSTFISVAVGTNLRVDYPGDTYYAPAGVLFPLTNPPIPATGGSGGSDASPTATTAPSPTATGAATAAATVPTLLTPTPLRTDSRGVYAASTPWYQRGGTLWWIILLSVHHGRPGLGGRAVARSSLSPSPA